MRLIAVTEIPKEQENRVDKKRLQELIDAFSESCVTIAKIDFASFEYKSINSCYTSLKAAVKVCPRPIEVHMRGSEIYIKKNI